MEGAVSRKISNVARTLEAMRCKLGDANFSEIKPAIAELKDAASQAVELENATIEAVAKEEA